MDPPNGLYECTEIEDVKTCWTPPIYYKSVPGRFPQRLRHSSRKSKCMDSVDPSV
jgi:hypothetical protein